MDRQEVCWSVCVCCDRWPWQWEAGREDGSNSAPARARPTCVCTRRLSAPWPACIFRDQSYIGMIANVRLISLSSSAGPIWISGRSNACDMKTRGLGNTKPVASSKNPLCHDSQAAGAPGGSGGASVTVTHVEPHAPEPSTSLTPGCTAQLVLHPLCVYRRLTSSRPGSTIQSRKVMENVAANYMVTHIQS